MNEFSDFFASWLHPESIGSVLLLIKLTLILAVILLIRAACVSRPAAFRHAILSIGLLGIPLLFVSHFCAPAWSIPGTESWIPEPNVVAVVQQEPREDRLPIEDGAIESGVSVVDREEAVSIDSVSSDSVLTSIPKGGLNSNEPHAVQESKDHASAGLVKNSLASELKLDADPNSAGKNLAASQPDSNVGSELHRGIVAAPAAAWNFARIKFCVLIVWAIGVVVFLSRLLAAWLVVGRLVRQAKLIDDLMIETTLPDAIGNMLRDIRAQNVDIKIAYSKFQTPLGFGVLRPTILLPSSCFAWTENQWRSVVLHEFAHIRRNDCLINVIARVQQAVLWFHPLFWTFVTQIRAESENSCDDFVIQSGVSNIEYADVLYQVAQQSLSSRHNMIATVTMSDATPLEARIHSILSSQTRRHPVKTSTLVLAAVALMAIAIPVSTAQLLKGPGDVESGVLAGGDVLNESGEKPEGLSVESLGEAKTNEEKQNTTLHFFVTKKNGDTFVGQSTAELEVQSSFGRSIFDANQIRLVKANDATDKKANEFKIEAVDGSTVFGRIKQTSLIFEVDEGSSIIVNVDELESASLIGRSGLKPDTITDGFAKNKVTYHIRAPKNYDPSKAYPAIVLLHGADSNAKVLIEKAARQFPRFANRYLLIGINGEFESSDKDAKVSPAYNYSYVNYVGASKYKGFPGTDRESPALVAEVLEEIRDYVPISKLFLGGNSDGGWLTYSMYMNFPQMIDGAFPITGAMIIQCQPDAYDDEVVRSHQRDTPIAIVHPIDDESLDRVYTRVAYERYLEDSFPMLSTFTSKAEGDELGGKNFAQAILWLESMSERDQKNIPGVIQHLIGQDRPRDAVGMITRVDFSKPGTSGRDSLVAMAESLAKAESPKFEKWITKNSSNHWIDSFLEFRKKYEFAPSAKNVMQKFGDLREQHEESANEFYTAARELFDENKDDEAYAKCHEIVDKFYASRRYRYAKRKLTELAEQSEEETASESAKEP